MRSADKFPSSLTDGLIGTLLSGLVFQLAGLTGCLWVSVLFLLITGGISLLLPR
ncbi:MAG: hypothetical protein GQ578_02035 [Desulfuromonadaceae bacterium]|nr:hypothetical protein [Desulfuromonadaceae bacterium]